MPQTTKITRAWRTDLVEGPAAVAGGLAAPFRRLGKAVARAGLAAWSQSFGGRAARFEEAAHDFTIDVAKSTDSEAIEFALVRLAGHIVPDGRVELIRATGEPACCKKWKVGSQSSTFAAISEDAAGRPDVGVEEVPVRWGTASHGVLRLHVPASWGRPAIGAETRRRLTMACTLAACALENARLRAEWIWGGEGDGDDGGPDRPALGDDDRSRVPNERPDVVRDATFLNAVLPFALAQSRRYGDPVSLLCVQVDRLGAIRNLLGATLADRLVSELASIVSGIVRASDIVARLDDDRIVALLVRARGDGAMGVARMITRTVADAGLGSSGLPGATISIGVAEFPATARDAASLLDAADEAMIMARAGGSRSPVLAGPRPSLVPSSDYAPAMAVSPALSACSC